MKEKIGVVILFICMIVFSNNSLALTLFDFEDGVQEWTTLGNGTLSQIPGGSDGTKFSLECSKTGSGFGCRSPKIENTAFADFNALILYRTQGSSNLASTLLINIRDKNGELFSKRARWAKTNETKLVITPFDLEHVNDDSSNSPLKIDLNEIDTIELWISDFQVVSRFENSSFIVDEISIETLTPNPVGSSNPIITVNCKNVLNEINERIYGVNLSFWDSQNGIRGSGNFGTGFFIKDNTEYETKVIDKWRNVYLPFHYDIGIKLLRWPGGLQANHYWWKDYIGSCNGIGPETRNGTTLPSIFGDDSTANPHTLAWDQVKFPFRHRAVIGIDEALQWAEDLGAEPLLMVNVNDNIKTGGALVDNNVNNLSGSDMDELANEAADLLEYCNAPDDGVNYGGGVDWASVRTSNGHKAPYNVRFWEYGNENWTITDPAKFGDVVARCIDLMEERQSQIDGTSKLDVRDKMYNIAVDNGGSGAHLFTDEEWYSTVLDRSVNNVPNRDRIDSWARHSYNNNSQCPSDGKDGKPCISGLRLQNDLGSLEVEVDFKASSDYRFWIYIQGVVNDEGENPQLQLFIDDELKGSYSAPISSPEEKELLVTGITSGVHKIRFQPKGTHFSPIGGMSDSKTSVIYLFPIIKAVNILNGEVLDFDLKNDREVAKIWQVSAIFNSDNLIEPVSQLEEKPPAVTEWSSLLAAGGGDVKYLTEDMDSSDKSRKGVTNRGDNMIEPLGWVDNFFKFAEHGVDVACFHQLYEDGNQKCLIEGVGEDSYTVIDSDAAASRELGRADPRLRPTAMAFKIFSDNFVGNRIFCEVKDAPKIETDWATSFQTSIENQTRFGVSIASSANWESGNNGIGLSFATGTGGGTFVGEDGSGILVDTISSGAAMPDNNHLNLLIVNKEDDFRQVRVDLNDFDPIPNAEVLILGVDSEGNQIHPQAGTDPEHCSDGDCIGIETDPKGFAIEDASNSFEYTLAPRSVHAIKFIRNGSDVISPLPPTSLIADGTVEGNSVMRLSWSESNGADGYNVYRSRAATGPFRYKCNSDLIKRLTFDDLSVFAEDLLYPGAEKNAQWNYAVTAVDTSGNESMFSPKIVKAAFGKMVTSDDVITTPTIEPTITPLLSPTPTTTPSLTPEPSPPTPKAFTFECDREFLTGPNGLEHLILNIDETASCVLRLTGVVPDRYVKIVTDVKAINHDVLHVSPNQGIPDRKGELSFDITGQQKGVAWIAWGLKDKIGVFRFVKNMFDNGKAWGMFVDVR